MALQEPYRTSTPVTDVTAAPAAPRPYIERGRTVEIARGWAWISEGFGFFRRQAGMWILLAVIFLGIMMGLQFVPVLGPLALILVLPVFAAGLISGCAAIERGGELELAHLFAGFRRNTGQLILVGAIGFALSAAIVVPVMAVLGTGGFFAALSGNPLALGASTMIGFLVALALLIPVNMALWFAPALVMLNEQSAPRAIAESFKGCLKNIGPFLVYGVILFALAMIASIPFGLGWLVLAPIVFASIYAAYRDIYAPGPAIASA